MKLTQIDIKGFKSIDGQNGQNIFLGNVTVLLGANGSGKSNLVAFFKMLNFLTTGALQNYVGKQGASQLLFYGPKVTESLSFVLHFSSDPLKVKGTYEVGLSYGLPDRLFISSEKITLRRNEEAQPKVYLLASGTAASGLSGLDHSFGHETGDVSPHRPEQTGYARENVHVTTAGLSDDKEQTSEIDHFLRADIRTYQFHDTSDTAKIKDRGYVDDAKYLRSDAGNLAPFLKMLKEHVDFKRSYERIIRRIQRVMPQFGDFSLETLPGNEKYVRLNWIDAKGGDYLFGPDQISDGSLRFMALTTLLLQPPALLPRFIVIDEPELGLHPSAIAELAGMVREVSNKVQVLVATQSTRLVDEFAPDELVIVERDETGRSSLFKKLDAEQLEEWLERYCLSELWEKNVLGGQP
ncbi:MAG: AAA family ATPase [Magnetococcales bacterium]|nr:AAA family ATPase [Magnetococcales bacterium]